MEAKQSNISQQLVAGHHIPSPEWREFMCGWGAAFINITVTFPINKIMFRQVKSPHIHFTSCRILMIQFALADVAWNAHQNSFQTVES